MLYVTIALAGSIAASFAYIAVRKVGPTVSVFVLIHYILLCTLLINIFQSACMRRVSRVGYYKLSVFPWPKHTTSPTAWWLLVATAFLGAGAQICINRGLQLEKAGPATSMRFLDIILSYVWQVWILHEHTDAYSIVGATLVSVCLIMMGMKKWWNVRKARLAYEQSLTVSSQ